MVQVDSYPLPRTLGEYGITARQYRCTKNYHFSVQVKSACTDNLFTFTEGNLTSDKYAVDGYVFVFFPISDDTYRILFSNTVRGYFFDAVIIDNKPVISELLDVFDLNSSRKKSYELAPYVYDGAYYCSFSYTSYNKKWTSQTVKGCPSVLPDFYPEQRVPYTISSIFIFLAIVALAIRLFIYPFWRKLKK